MAQFRQKLIAVLIGIVLFILFDIVLALFGLPTLADEDTFAGFNGHVPFLVEDENWQGAGEHYQLNPAKQEYFNPQSVSMPKNNNALRLVALGGSTTYGRPWMGKTAFAQWLALLDEQLTDGAVIEPINAGGISYASYRVRRLMSELLSFDQDLFVIYAGHNEFLEERSFSDLKHESSSLAEIRRVLHHSPTYSWLYRQLKRFQIDNKSPHALPAEVHDRLTTVAGTDLYHRDNQLRQYVIEQYRASLQGMVDLARRNNVGIVFCTLPSNLADFSPFKSEHRAGLTSDEYREWNTHYLAGQKAAREGSPEEAIELYSKAQAIDDSYAMLHFLVGRSLLELGRHHAARQAFIRAKEEDIVPLRALDEMNRIVRDIAAREKIPLADVEAVFSRVAANGIPGNDLFVDHVHPTIEGQQLIAWVVFDTLVKNDMIPVSLAKWQESAGRMRALLRQELLSLDADYLALGYWGVGRVLFWAQKYAESQVAYQAAWEYIKDSPDIPLKLGFLALFEGDGERALHYLTIADSMDESGLDAKVGLANAHVLLGDGEKALQVLAELPPDSNDKAGVLEARGRAYLSLGRYNDAVESFRQAVLLAPETARFARLLAQALRSVGKIDAAKREYRRYLEMTRHPAPEDAVRSWMENERTNFDG